ncbi:putative succinate-semialdehyde dehydrogenase (NAD(+)) [Helianthus annuus]|uniref:Succinate-semialdehyde dehydrogenase n=1 Tax=Helianthus annuus TaxID=4232 RepID=A0A251T9W7_HELAN|nr:succinate-semialdehyde dehydrogenase, mitochondrial isoform X1 [Helianthus annuus]XP_021993449.1 succinate-semialdehyde dehydrogenase, mitochondrial isoform X2 [Helianthus annuus]XP_021993451.1 succinate-semialdehyde dehydrogenase, mitochondrial isoform X1 [Helianthus annuus]XP_035835648.1 succinate-semialdehyde dehydrogenase, mitochondrial isoform X1 [Helianthus annuus]KAF5781482.1 putative succinate-semialdehyde dehydrogenase (NAD(+)) [Helianthus annuus]KAF5781484.1 putative succinate-sem
MSMETENVVARLKSSGLFQTKGLIGGKWIDAYDGKTVEVYNPANGEVIASVACMGERETKDAISSAYDAFSHWSKLTAADRSSRLYKWYNLLIEQKEVLGQLITLEQGKPLKEAIGEVVYGASYIEYFAEEAKRVYGDILPSPMPDRRLFVLKQPVGVVGAITPWNFPLAMITRKAGPALACGCTLVIKPSELTPLTALAAAELALQAGIPPGVLNVVMGDAPKIGKALLESPQVRKLTFTGSTAVGKKLMAGAAETVKKVSLELGGNAPCIVFDDADLEVALEGSLATKLRNSGQTCICTNRLLVQEGIYDKFINAYSNAVQSLKVGNGFSEGVDQGPLINEAAVQKVDSLVQDAISQGAKVVVGGKRHNLGLTFYEPTIISDVKNEMLIARREIFGPVTPVIRFKTEEEAIQIANDTDSGLAAYLFTNNIPRLWRVSEALEYGLVGVNNHVAFSQVAPFGGVKQSGLGREGSKYGLDEYLEIKCICMGNMG